MNLLEEVSKLQQRLADAERERSRAQGAYESAKTLVTAAREELQREFEVDTVEAAETLMETMQQELASLVQKINTELDRAGVE